MAKKLTFEERLQNISKKSYKDAKLVSIAKNEYLLLNKDKILMAHAIGYTFPVIAEAATEELLHADIPTSFLWLTTKNEKKYSETKFRAGEIKKFCEENS